MVDIMMRTDIDESTPLYRLNSARLVGMKDYPDLLTAAEFDSVLNPGMTWEEHFAGEVKANGVKFTELKTMPFQQDMIMASDIGFIYVYGSVSDLRSITSEEPDSWVHLSITHLRQKREIELLIDLTMLSSNLDMMINEPLVPLKMAYLIAMPSPASPDEFIPADYYRYTDYIRTFSRPSVA